MRRRQRQEIADTALIQFQARPAEVSPPLAAEDYLPKRRRTWGDRASEELECAMELDLEPDRKARKKYIPSYERVAEHLKEKGFH